MSNPHTDLIRLYLKELIEDLRAFNSWYQLHHGPAATPLVPDPATVHEWTDALALNGDGLGRQRLNTRRIAAIESFGTYVAAAHNAAVSVVVADILLGEAPPDDQDRQRPPATATGTA